MSHLSWPYQLRNIRLLWYIQHQVTLHLSAFTYAVPSSWSTLSSYVMNLRDSVPPPPQENVSKHQMGEELPELPALPRSSAVWHHSEIPLPFHHRVQEGRNPAPYNWTAISAEMFTAMSWYGNKKEAEFQNGKGDQDVTEPQFSHYNDWG